MIADLALPPQINLTTLDGAVALELEVTGSPTVFPDHESFVTCALRRASDRKPLVEASRVPAQQANVMAWATVEAGKLRDRFDRETVLRRKQRGW